jgi:uracil-DNA glycosylase family 4
MRRQELEAINRGIIDCEACPRLTPYIRQVAQEKVKRFRDREYWGRPVPGFGDPEARLLIVGLAPAAHGANRTGRMFTGDRSGDWLYGAGFANQADSVHRDDGLELIDAYIISVIRCAPPQNKPKREEIQNCSEFFHRELELFSDAPFILCLGRLAFDEVRKYHGVTGIEFGHGREHELPNGQTLLCSYHPSQQNTNTGRLKWSAFTGVFERVRRLLPKSNSNSNSNSNSK